MAEDKNAGFKANLGALANKVKTAAPNTPLQEVVPVVVPKKAKEDKPEEAQLNVWIPKDLVKRMKRHGLDADLSLKEITIAALEAYLSK